MQIVLFITRRKVSFVRYTQYLKDKLEAAVVHVLSLRSQEWMQDTCQGVENPVSRSFRRNPRSVVLTHLPMNRSHLNASVANISALLPLNTHETLNTYRKGILTGPYVHVWHW